LSHVANAVHPDALPLLNRLVDRLDEAAAAGRQLQRPVRLNERTCPELYHSQLEGDKELLWKEIERLASAGFFSIELERAQPFQAAYERTPRLRHLNEERLRVACARVTRARSVTEKWKEAVSHSTLPDEAKPVVSGYRLEIPGRDVEEIVAALERMPALADEPLLLREVSARLFWGQSKVLDGRQGLVQAVLGASECPFPEMPVQLHVCMPHSKVSGCLFIENLATFERAVASREARYEGLALVYAAGFKGSARRLRTQAGCSLYWSNRGLLDPTACLVFEQWLSAGPLVAGPPVWFWGDLDFSGMRILAALRGSFPGAHAWQPGYAPMVARIQANVGHTPDAAGKQLQQDLVATGCEFADTVLLPAIRATGYFLDQEAVA
jgi:hypothetical protein